MPTMLLHNQAFPAEIYTGVWCRQVKNRLLHHSQLTIDDIGLTRLLMVRNATLVFKHIDPHVFLRAAVFPGPILTFGQGFASL